jgi:hypothetical protein
MRRIIEEESTTSPLLNNPNKEEKMENVIDTLSNTTRELYKEKDKENPALDERSIVEKFLEFLAKEMDNLQEYSKLSLDPSFQELNACLAHYESVLLTLVATYAELRLETAQKKMDYEDTFARYYIKIRERENPKTESASKWLSQKEIEYYVKAEYGDKLRALEENWLYYDHKLSAIRRLIECWNSFNYTLSNLSKNVQVEATARIRDAERLDDDRDQETPIF